MKKLLALLVPTLGLMGCSTLPTSINDVLPDAVTSALGTDDEVIYMTVRRCSDDFMEFQASKNKHYSLQETLARRELGEIYQHEKLNCVPPAQFEKLELSDHCRHQKDGSLECYGSPQWILKPENYKVRDNALMERQRHREQFETVEVVWEYVDNSKSYETTHNIGISHYRRYPNQARLEKLQKDPRCKVLREGRKLICQMRPQEGFVE